MKLALLGVLALSCALAVIGCGSDDKSEPVAGAGGDDPANVNGDGGSPTFTVDDPCHLGCIDTIAAACSNGPADLASCDNQCNALSAGSCGGEYATFQTCAKGKAITCSAQGQPMVEECSDQQAAFVACINAG
jgi:hypothetical protein